CWNFQPNSTYSGPIGLKGPQLPRTGNAMAGFFSRTILGFDQREYMQVRLAQPLRAGRYYSFSFYVSLADNHEFASNRIGALLSTTAVSIANDKVIAASPQILENGIISDTSNWVLVSDTIQAAQAFEYFTIGNFFDDASTDTVTNPGASGQPGTYGAYYFVDDCRGREVAPPVNLSDETLCLGDSLSLDVNLPAVYNNVRYLWTTGATTSGIVVKDQGYYGVQVTIDDTLIVGDTIFVDVEFCPPVLNMANVFSPNGDGVNDIFRPVSFSQINNVTLAIFDRWGKKLFETTDLNNGWNGTLEGKECPEGVYFWAVSYRGKSQESERMAGHLTLMR
ncbi:MAG TPA: gliding motility-associated C-terminal domain-containing protein, partial [Bacteroidetes bacterium]|nr:gliding motility-associated C-terminal domain-containing protein [Bacteroidota bacterium]